ncbi:MAG: N-6 DNA methylase, partial [Patescibacteria group bacterium]
IMYSLSAKGKAAVVVPTGFITAQSGIEKKIRQKLIDAKILKGAVSMPSNIFATTGTNVSVIFIDRENTSDKVVLMDASNLGTMIKEGKNQKTVLSPEEEKKIIDVFNKQEAVEDLSVVISFDEVKEKNYSFSAGQYFDVKIDFTDMTSEEFMQKIRIYSDRLDDLFKQSDKLESQIKNELAKLKYE